MSHDGKELSPTETAELSRRFGELIDVSAGYVVDDLGIARVVRSTMRIAPKQKLRTRTQVGYLMHSLLAVQHAGQCASFVEELARSWCSP